MTVSTHKLSPTSLAASAAASETPPSLLSTSISHSDATSVVRSTSKGSTEGASLSTQNLTNSTSSGAATMVSTSPEQEFLKDLVDFLEKNVLLILVITALVLLVFLMICGGLLMSRRRKVNSYYPASFPSKMYVDERDKTGGARSFNEVQGKAACEHESSPVDSHRQLQADIMRVAKSLRAASKSTDATEKDESCQQEADPASENISKSNCTILDQALSSVPEEKEPCELGDSGTASGEKAPLEEACSCYGKPQIPCSAAF
uniref:Transmembrane protein 119b n=1 Tax=Oryzias latipes TaxID=8090 RepID=H2LWC6_ORYLA